MIWEATITIDTEDVYYPHLDKKSVWARVKTSGEFGMDVKCPLEQLVELIKLELMNKWATDTP